MPINLSPVVLFVYNRPWHTEQTLRALQQNDLAAQTELYIYADGPKPYAEKEQLQKIQQVRELIRREQWCGTVHIIESASNKGLADSVIAGVTEVVNRHDRVIVLEDDIVPSKGFLRYMNDALELYKDDERVMQVSGYIYPYSPATFDNTTCFLRVMACWGWATWSRAWYYFEPDVKVHLQHYSTKEDIRNFNINGHMSFYGQLLANRNNELYTWAVKWYASWLYAGGYSLFPCQSLICNAGFDSSGENCSNKDHWLNEQQVEYLTIEQIPVTESYNVRVAIDKQFAKRKYPKTLKATLCYGLDAIGLMKPIYKLYKKTKTFCEHLSYLWSKKSSWFFVRSSETAVQTEECVLLKRPYHISRTDIGKYTYIGHNAVIYNTTIGRFCSIGNNFTCCLGIHPLNGLSTSPMFYSKGRQNGTTLSASNKIEEFQHVEIGNDVFIGDRVTILSGVVIGDGAVIGAGSVVTADVPPYAIVGGVPAKLIRYRFTPKQVAALLRIKWWNFDVSELPQIERLFWDIDEFIRLYDK